MPLSDKTIYGWVQGWVDSNKKKIVKLYLQKGGWEGWAQAELALHLETLPGDPTIEREVHVFENGRQAVDIKITCIDGTTFVVELKCESLFASAGSATIGGGNSTYALFEADINKLRHIRDVNANTMAIMIAVSSEAQAGFASLVMSNEIEHEYFLAGDDWKIYVYKY